MPKAVYGDYKFDLDEAPWSQPVSGEQIRDQVARRIGEQPQGAPYIRREDGSMEHVDANERVAIGPRDSVGFTSEFETASRFRSST